MKQDIFGESVRGAAHYRSGVECQDSFRIAQCDNNTYVLAVADGHGSSGCPFSKTGSTVATDVFCDLMKDYVGNYADSVDALISFLNRDGDTKIAKSIHDEWKLRIKKCHAKYHRPVFLDDVGEMIEKDIYAQYGTTLLGLVISKEYYFALQIGDGDILYVDGTGVTPLIESEKILGVETHSLCKIDAWKHALTAVRRVDFDKACPMTFMMSTDGFSNSYPSEEEFHKTCSGYFECIKEHSVESVSGHLFDWLVETSSGGCGDDITVLMAYYSKDNDGLPGAVASNDLEKSVPQIVDSVESNAPTVPSYSQTTSALPTSGEITSKQPKNPSDNINPGKIGTSPLGAQMSAVAHDASGDLMDPTATGNKPQHIDQYLGVVDVNNNHEPLYDENHQTQTAAERSVEMVDNLMVETSSSKTGNRPSVHAKKPSLTQKIKDGVNNLRNY